MARGPLTPRPSQRLTPGTDTVAFTATVSALAMVDTALATAMERGPLTPMPTMVTQVLDMDMEVMAMVDSTDMVRGPLTPRPSQRLTPGTDTVAFTATVLALAMEVTALAMAMERGPLTP